MTETERFEELRGRIRTHLLHAYGEATMLPKSREVSLVLTKLDEARQWLNDAHAPLVSVPK